MKRNENSILEARTRGDIIFDIFRNVFLIAIVFICIYPIYYAVVASFSDPNAVLGGKVYLWPVDFTLDSYRSVLDYKPIWTGYRNTLFYTSVGTVYNMFLLLPASYALSKKSLKGRNLFMFYFIFTMYFSGGTVPYYLVVRNLGLIDSPWAMIIPASFSVYNMIIVRTYFSSFPEALRESAKIDGAGEGRIFVQIVLPLSKPIIAVMVLYHAVDRWNQYFPALLFLNDTKYYPLQMVLRQVLMMNQSISANVNGMSTEALADLVRRQRLAETMKYALIIIANLPVLIAYPFVQKHFVKGIMIGSIKG